MVSTPCPLIKKAELGLAVADKLPADAAKTISMAAAGAPSALAITNALVRIMIGPLADKIGTKKIFITLFIIQAGAMVALFPAGNTATLLALCAAVIGWNYGAMFTLFPATLLQLLRSDRSGLQLWSAVHRLGCCRFLRPLPRW